MPVTPTRILRAEARDIDPTPPAFNTREQARHERIITVATALMAAHGRDGVSFTGLAGVLDIATATLRRHFPDLDDLLATILRRHLQALSAALGQVPADAPDVRRARRLAYIAATRNGRGTLTEPHLLLVRDLHRLPEDLRVSLETTHFGVAEMCLGPNAARARPILDLPGFTIDEIESALAPFLPANAAVPIYIGAGELARPPNRAFRTGNIIDRQESAPYQPRNTTALNPAPFDLAREFTPPPLACLRPG